MAFEAFGEVVVVQDDAALALDQKALEWI